MKIERKSDWLNVIRRLEKEATEWVGRPMGGVYSRSERPRPPLRTTTPAAAAAANTDQHRLLWPQLLPQRRRKQSQKQFKLWSDERQAIKPLDSPICLHLVALCASCREGEGKRGFLMSTPAAFFTAGNKHSSSTATLTNITWRYKASLDTLREMGIGRDVNVKRKYKKERVRTSSLSDNKDNKPRWL